MKYSMGETSQFSSDNINMNSYFAEVSSLLYYFLCPVYCVMFIENIVGVCIESPHNCHTFCLPRPTFIQHACNKL